MQTIRIPTRADGGVVADLAVGVSFKRIAEEFQAVELQCDHSGLVEFTGEVGSSQSVCGISTFVLASGVVEKPEKEHDLGIAVRRRGHKVESRRRDGVPMAFAMERRVAAPSAGENAIHELEAGQGNPQILRRRVLM